MNRLHIGRGTTRGALTVFPVWAEDAHAVAYSLDARQAAIGELPGGASVPRVSVANPGGVPLLLLEGQLLEGGMQHRMVARSVLLAPEATAEIDVVCVEAGRWNGLGRHSARGLRASARVRNGLRTPDRQAEVWRRVSDYDRRRGASPTSSYVDHAERAATEVRELIRGLRPFPGQVGILIGIAGQPVFAEIFDSPRMLARQFESIVAAAAMDAIDMPPIGTPTRRAHRFIDRAALVPAAPVGDAGIARAIAGRTEYVDLAGIAWAGRDIHTLLINPRHELALAA